MATASAPRLYDATGTEIPLPGPQEPPSGTVSPGVNGAASDRFRLYPSRNLTPESIVQILEEADAGDPYRLIELIEEITEKDGKVEAVIKARSQSMQGMEWNILQPKLRLADQASEDKAKEIALFCEQALRSTEFSELIGDLMDGVSKPFAVDWITWGQDSLGKYVPTQFSRINPKHLRWSFADDSLRVFDPVRPSIGKGGDWGEPLAPYTTIRAIDLSRRDHPTRAGIGRTLIWPVFFKLTIVKDMVGYGERAGIPPRVLRIDQVDFDNPERYEKFRRAMMEFRHDLSAVISKNAELDIKVIASKDGVEVFTSQIDIFDKWIAWKVLGHELTSQSSPGQGQLGITAAMEVRQDIKEADCRWIAGIIKRDVLTPMVGWNFGWDAVQQHLVPNLWFDVELPRDITAESQVVDRIATRFPNLTFSKQQIRENFGIAAPLGEDQIEAEDDVLRPSAGGSPAAVGASGAGDPSSPPAEGPDAAPGSVNSRSGAASTLSASEPQSPEKKQIPVDAAVVKGAETGQPVAEKWEREIRDVLRQCQAEGLTFAQTADRVRGLYPALAVKGFEKDLRQWLFLCRLHGRNS
jgi:phage gp29-like protein